MRHGVMTKTFTYENNTGLPIFVTEAHGGHFILEPKNNRVISPNAVVVYVTYKVPAGTANLLGFAESYPPAVYRNMCAELRAFGETTLMYVVEDPVPIIRGDAVILEELGLAFSIRPIGIDKAPARANHGKPSAMTIGVVVVQRYDDSRDLRWVRYYTSMVEVVPVRSKFYDEGIYMVLMSGEIVEGGRLLAFNFDDPLSPFRAFETEDAARSFRWELDAIPDLRDIRMKMEQQIQNNEQSILERKGALELEHKRRLADLAIDKEETAAAYRDLEYQIKQRAEERKDQYEERSTIRKDTSEDRKDHYDSRSSKRKDNTEILKVFPALLAAGIAIVAMVK